jgi:hypothetical protein
MLGTGAAKRCRTRPPRWRLTRQNLPALRTEFEDRQPLRGFGAYELSRRPATTPSYPSSPSGSEVEIATGCPKEQLGGQRPPDPRRLGALHGHLPTPNPPTMRDAIIGKAAKVKIAVEAGIRQGWDAIIGLDGAFRRHGLFRGFRPLQGTLRPFRHHARGDRECGRNTHSRWRATSLRSPQLKRRNTHDRQSRHQRIWPHRPQRLRAISSPAARTSRSSRSTISARSRPTPT